MSFHFMGLMKQLKKKVIINICIGPKGSDF